MQTISREELKTLLDQKEKFLLLNVLSEEKFEDEHIKGSKHIHFKDDDEDFVHQVGNTANSKSQLIVTYCAGPKCPASAEAARALEKAGYTNVKAFEGGMEEWKDASYPTEGEEASVKTKETETCC